MSRDTARDRLIGVPGYTPGTDGKNLWLLLQLACMVAYMVGVIVAAAGVKRLSRAAP